MRIEIKIQFLIEIYIIDMSILIYWLTYQYAMYVFWELLLTLFNILGLLLCMLDGLQVTIVACYSWR
jgi:hypothetical protein